MAKTVHEESEKDEKLFYKKVHDLRKINDSNDDLYRMTKKYMNLTKNVKKLGE
jgi:hypothetical protein